MIIAIPTNNTSSNTEIPKYTQNSAYCRYVKNAGYSPILVPMETNPEVIAQMADGLLLAGGIDVDPIYYELSNVCSIGVDPEKDSFERKLFHAFRNLQKPIFGICRGFQLIMRELLFKHENKDTYNFYFEYLENISNHTQTGSLGVPRRFPSHRVKADIEGLYGIDDANIEMISVNSMHHQAVAVNHMLAVNNFAPELKLTPGFNCTEPAVLDIEDVDLLAWSLRGVTQPIKNSKKPDFDNYWSIVEAVRINNWCGSIMGVQWHPEELNDVALLRNFFGDGEDNIIIGEV